MTRTAHVVHQYEAATKAESLARCCAQLETQDDGDTPERSLCAPELLSGSIDLVEASSALVYSKSRAMASTWLLFEKVLLGHRSEEVYSALVDAEDELGRKQPNGVLNPLHGEED
ncbi:MAG: hypothetical protein FRX49_03490 [Trebouxia sp. A1-2]|nr:MAG: hypothetical protein FRX49_03490 [Trebouxia sp. A1-2]